MSNLMYPSLYPFADHPTHITLKRSDLERCIRVTLEEAMEEGGSILELAHDFMAALDGYDESILTSTQARVAMATTSIISSRGA